MDMDILFCLLALCSTPPNYGNYCAQVEVNHVVDPWGGDRFTQLIYREANGLIRDWRYLQNNDMLPDSRMHLAVWREQGQWRMLWVGDAFETWTRTDPERDEANWRPASERKRLFNTNSESD